MRVLVAQHDADSGPGTLEGPLRRRGCALELWFPGEAPPPALDGIGGVISLGAHADPDDDDSEPWLAAERDLIARVLDARTPFLGICLGAELLAQVAGGRAGPDYPSQIGWRRLERCAGADGDPLLGDLPDGHPAFQWHSHGPAAPPGAALIARAEGADQAFRVGPRAWGVHFHLEVDMTTVALWSVLGRDQLARSGVDPDALRQETARHEEAHLALARRVAGRFADLVAEAAES